MKQRRLGLLLAVMVGLLALRLLDLRSPSSSSVSEAVDRVVVKPSTAALPSVPASAVKKIPDRAAVDRVDDDAQVRNAFAVRPPLVAAVVTPKQTEQPKPFVGPPVPPPPPPPPPPEPPPFNVIGSWRDDGGASVFLAGPRGVLLAHVGDVLLAEYAVTRIGPTELVLKQLSSNREIALPVPVAAAAPLSSSPISVSTTQ